MNPDYLLREIFLMMVNEQDEDIKEEYLKVIKALTVGEDNQ